MDDKSLMPENNIWSNEVLTVREIADYLRVSRVTIWRWCQQGTLPAFQVGRNWRIRREDFLTFEASLKRGGEFVSPPDDDDVSHMQDEATVDLDCEDTLSPETTSETCGRQD